MKAAPGFLGRPWCWCPFLRQWAVWRGLLSFFPLLPPFPSDSFPGTLRRRAVPAHGDTSSQGDLVLFGLYFPRPRPYFLPSSQPLFLAADLPRVLWTRTLRTL